MLNDPRECIWCALAHVPAPSILHLPPHHPSSQKSPKLRSENTSIFQSKLRQLGGKDTHLNLRRWCMKQSCLGLGSPQPRCMPVALRVLGEREQGVMPCGELPCFSVIAAVCLSAPLLCPRMDARLVTTQQRCRQWWIWRFQIVSMAVDHCLPVVEIGCSTEPMHFTSTVPAVVWEPWLAGVCCSILSFFRVSQFCSPPPTYTPQNIPHSFFSCLPADFYCGTFATHLGHHSQLWDVSPPSSLPVLWALFASSLACFILCLPTLPEVIVEVARWFLFILVH